MEIRENLVPIAIISGAVFLLMSYILLLLTFTNAFISPDLSTLVIINKYNEMWVEVFLFLYSIPCVVVTVVWVLKRLRPD